MVTLRENYTADYTADRNPTVFTVQLLLGYHWVHKLPAKSNLSVTQIVGFG
jgi:hypothetical protein